MEKYTLRQLKDLVSVNMATDISRAKNKGEVSEPLAQVGYSSGVYGCNGKLFKGLESGLLYAVIGRTPALWIF